MNNVLSQVIFDVKHALQEDVGNGDVTAALLPQQLIVEAEIISREPMVVCGQPWVNEVFKQVDNTVEMEWRVSEGDF